MIFLKNHQCFISNRQHTKVPIRRSIWGMSRTVHVLRPFLKLSKKLSWLGFFCIKTMEKNTLIFPFLFQIMRLRNNSLHYQREHVSDDRLNSIPFIKSKHPTWGITPKPEQIKESCALTRAERVLVFRSSSPWPESHMRGMEIFCNGTWKQLPSNMKFNCTNLNLEHEAAPFNSFEVF